jgi:C1A family cysteine protease
VFGVNVTKPCPDGSIGAFEMQNSWGREWGDNGRAWLSFKAAAALLAENGEAATPTEILHK